MPTYDIVMIAILVLATGFGFYKGMAWQVASSASLVLSYFVALRFSERAAPYFGQQAPLNRFLAMAALYTVTALAIWLAFRAVRDFVDRVRLKEFDQQMGALFGAGKGVLWCVAITFFAVTLSERARAAVLQSHSGHYIAVFLNRADAVMPKELHEVLDKYLNQLEQGLDPGNGHPPRGNEPAPAWPSFPPPQQPAQQRRG